MTKNSQQEKLKWFKQARFGMFIHWGLYTGTDLDCWMMYDMGMPASEYIEKYEPKFTGSKFDADETMRLAKQAGCKYVVMGSRHHEGYCLWDTDTTDFSSAKKTPKRDFIAEYVQAARKHKLKVGLYYSLLDWRIPAYWKGPKNDPQGWADMIKYIHTQVNELMTRYGKIDILWYDGAWPPQTGDWNFSLTESYGLAEAWQSKKLNAMVRKCQPRILINNRADTPEDFGTPEQRIVPEDRAWECCDTMGDLWGYSSVDMNRKNPRQLINNLISCVSHGGNLLLNIGPKVDGSIASWQRKNLEKIGQWMDVHSESIYGCREELRWPYFSQLAPWRPTRKGNTIYLHLVRYPGTEFALTKSHGDHLVSASILDTGQKLQIKHEATRDIISGLPKAPPDKIATVIKIKIKPESKAQKATRKIPALPESQVL